VGLAGQRWLAALPALVSSLEADWAVTCGTALEGGSTAYVAEAVTADGQLAVLKIAEPAHDLGVVLRGWNEDLLAAHAAAVAFQRCEAVSRRTGVDPESIWQWAYIERVSSGLFLLRLGHPAVPRSRRPAGRLRHAVAQNGFIRPKPVADRPRAGRHSARGRFDGSTSYSRAAALRDRSARSGGCV
jgi:hypothetical protein